MEWLLIVLLVVCIFLIKFITLKILMWFGEPVIKNMIDDCVNTNELYKNGHCVNCRSVCEGCTKCSSDIE